MKTRGAIGGRRTHDKNLREQSLNVEEGDVEHEGEEKDDEEHLGTLEKGKGEGFAPNLFDRCEEHVSTIENGNGQKVEDGQVDVDEYDEPKKVLETDLGEQAKLFDDPERLSLIHI